MVLPLRTIAAFPTHPSYRPVSSPPSPYALHFHAGGFGIGCHGKIYDWPQHTSSSMYHTGPEVSPKDLRYETVPKFSKAGHTTISPVYRIISDHYTGGSRERYNMLTPWH